MARKIYGECKICGQKTQLLGTICENCKLELEAKHDPSREKKQEKQSKEEIEKELAERRRDPSFWR